MNRIKLSPLATETAPQLERSALPGLNAPFEPVGTTAKTACSFFVPMHYEKNYAYPLIVWLHANGQSADQVQEVMLDLSLRNHVAVAPQSPCGSPRTGYFWDQSDVSVEAASDGVFEAIEQARSRFHVASHRIFIAGVDAGGTMAFRVAFQNPQHFAGVLSINGPLPDSQSVLGTWPVCRKIPVFWTQVRKSEFDQEQLCEQLKLLHIAGFSVTLRQYPHTMLADQPSSVTLSDANRWIMDTIASTIK